MFLNGGWAMTTHLCTSGDPPEKPRSRAGVKSPEITKIRERTSATPVLSKKEGGSEMLEDVFYLFLTKAAWRLWVGLMVLSLAVYLVAKG